MKEELQPLLQRFCHILWAFSVIGVITLALAFWLGDARAVALVHAAGWTRAHYSFLLAFTDLGLYPFYVLFLVLFAWGYLRNDHDLKLLAQGYLLAQFLGSALMVSIIKISLGRARPDATTLPDFGSQWAGFRWDAAHHSFPSGHTADIVTGALFAALLFRSPLAVAACITWAAAVGLSRLAVAKHYPSDALTGAVIAVGVSMLVLRYWLLPRLTRLRGGVGVRWWRSGGENRC